MTLPPFPPSLRGLAQLNVSPEVLWAVAITVTAVFLMMGVGALARQRQWLSASADATLLSLFVRLFLPALIFKQVLGREALRSSARSVVGEPGASVVRRA